jgi:ribosome maturation factor RimP
MKGGSSAVSESPVIQRVRDLVDPIASDLELDLYDVEQRGATLRVTLDTPPGSEGGVDLDKLALATRLISREMDHTDPVPGRYTLEVTSPGVERNLRTPAHFQREIGKTIAVRLADVSADRRRLEGVLVAADDVTATIRPQPEAGQVDDQGDDRVIALADIDRARTVFVWGPQPKPGGKGTAKNKQNKNSRNSNKNSQSAQRSDSESP